MQSPSPPTPTAPTASTTATTSASDEPASRTEYRDQPATTTSTFHNESAVSSSPASPSPFDDGDEGTKTPPIVRPKMGTRKSSGTIIVPREHPRVELKEGDEVFDEDDARAMSPRRSSRDLERMGQEARAQLNEHAKILQKSLLEIFNRIEAVKEEHNKLDNNNKFLQKYIGDLMSTSKITSTGSSGRKK